MQKKEKLYEGKAKVLYETDSENLLIQHFKDDVTAFDGVKHEVLEGKGTINCAITSKIFKFLEENGIKTHFVEKIAPNEIVVKRCEIIPVEVVVRNIAAGSFSKRYGIEEGEKLKKPIVEYFYKSDELHDPMVCKAHIDYFEWATAEEIDVMTSTALRINALLSEFFRNISIMLVDFKLEFGRHKGEIVLADEITPDSCRLWDITTGEKLDKDRFRRDLGNLIESYREIYRRIEDRYGE